MPSYNITELKAAQDSRKAQKKELIKLLDQFWDGLIKELAVFTTAAIEAGIEDVKPCKPHARQRHMRVADVTIAGFDLQLLASDNVGLIDHTSPMAARVFVYPNRAEATPLVDYLILSLGPDRHQLRMRCFANTSIQLHFTSENPGEAGSDAAGGLIRYLYGFQQLWQERPTLTQTMLADAATGPIGYRLPPTQ